MPTPNEAQHYCVGVFSKELHLTTLRKKKNQNLSTFF